MNIQAGAVENLHTVFRLDLIEKSVNKIFVSINFEINGTFSFEIASNFIVTNFWIGPYDEEFKVKATLAYSSVGQMYETMNRTLHTRPAEYLNSIPNNYTYDLFNNVMVNLGYLKYVNSTFMNSQLYLLDKYFKVSMTPNMTTALNYLQDLYCNNEFKTWSFFSFLCPHPPGEDIPPPPSDLSELHLPDSLNLRRIAFPFM